MALKKSKLSQIPQRNKDLAFGYVREREKTNTMSVPDMIKYLCLIYFHPNKDEFDPDHCSNKIKINGNCIFGPIESTIWTIAHVCLKNIASSHIHEWKFKYGRDDKSSNKNMMMIGIISVDDKDSITPTENKFYERYPGKCTRYTFASNGYLTNPISPSAWGNQYGSKWKIGDAIEMRLDLNEQNLKFKINDNDCGIAFEIDSDKKWKAVVSIVGEKVNGKSDLTLTSYQAIY